MSCPLSAAKLSNSQDKTSGLLTLANKTHQETSCLCVATPNNPFSTCLVGLARDEWPVNKKAFSNMQSNSPNTKLKFNPVDFWDSQSPSLPHEPLEPQELQLFGSVKMDYCITFRYKKRVQSVRSNGGKPQIVKTDEPALWDVSPHHPGYKNESLWCNYTSQHPSKPSDALLQLPPGTFLVCGDRAWPAIPSHIKAGPSGLGRLTLLTPDVTTLIGNGKNRKNSFAHQFQSDCTSRLEFWNRGQRITASALVPWVVAAVGMLVK